MEPAIDVSYGSQELYALAVGLALRDITNVVSHDENLPPHLKDSKLGSEHLATVAKLCCPTVKDPDQPRYVKVHCININISTNIHISNKRKRHAAGEDPHSPRYDSLKCLVRYVESQINFHSKRKKDTAVLATRSKNSPRYACC